MKGGYINLKCDFPQKETKHAHSIIKSIDTTDFLENKLDEAQKRKLSILIKQGKIKMTQKENNILCKSLQIFRGEAIRERLES